MKRLGLPELLEKYREIRRLRTAPTEVAAPREALVALAQRFPGALRELDAMPLETIERRIAELERAIAKDQAAPWMEAQALFHPLARGALAAKAWLGGRRAITADDEASFAKAFPEGDDAHPWKDHLAEIASPPRGRITDLVCAHVAAELQEDPAQIRHRLFGFTVPAARTDDDPGR